MQKIKNKQTECHLRIELKDFVPALERAEKVMNRKSAMPILGTVLLTKDGDTFQLTAGNGEHVLRQKADGIVCIEGTMQPMCLPVQGQTSVSQALRMLPQQGVIQVWVDYVKKTMLIEYVTNPLAKDGEDIRSGQFTLPFDATDEYPETPDVPAAPVCSMKVDGGWLLPRVKSARVSVDNNELRPQMGCVCLDADMEGVTVVSSDGHTLYKDRLQHGVPFLTAGSPAKMLVHFTLLPVVDAAFSRKDELTVMTDGQKTFILSPDGTLLVCSQPDKKYPNYNAVIPKNNTLTCTVVVRDFLAALKRVQMFASDSSNMVRMSIAATGDTMRVAADDIDFSKSAYEDVRLLDRESITEAFEIGFKASSLMAMLSVIETENAVFSFSSPQAAGLIRNEDQQSELTCLVMPMLLSQQ